MPKNYIKYKETALRNNCPECFSNSGLRLSFSQEIIENTFYTKATKNRKPSILCVQCETPIYPARWTDDIDRVVDYTYERAVPENIYFKLKPLSWVLIGTSTVLIALGIYLLLHPDFLYGN
ncbi:MAG: hypothetical protein WBG71_02950 [Leeuwenhoekiella sp.]